MLAGVRSAAGEWRRICSEPHLTPYRKSDQLDEQSSDPKKIVFALIRSQATAGDLNKLTAERKNIHVILTDISNPQKLQVAAGEVSNITGGGLDVLIFNAFLPGTEGFQLPASGL